MERKTIPPRGLEGPNRALLEQLHRGTTGPFTVEEAAALLALPRGRVRRLLSYLAGRGWLSRVCRGLYITVPLGARDPAAWLADPWSVANKLFAPCYLGGWTALQHWELTDQIFRDVVVFTALEVKRKHRTVQGTTFRLRSLPAEKHFGTRAVWRDRARLLVSDPARTIVDVLDRPEVGGGIRHVAECLVEFLESRNRDDVALVDYADRLGNRTVFKRLGFLVESKGMEARGLLEACRERMSSGLSPLDPGVEAAGRIVKRWNLFVNAKV